MLYLERLKKQKEEEQRKEEEIKDEAKADKRPSPIFHRAENIAERMIKKRGSGYKKLNFTPQPARGWG